MKFPYELSEQRQSLLSKDDQLLYKYEHSDFFDYNTKQKCMQEYQNALLERQEYYMQKIKKDPQFNTLNESEVFETANELALYEANNYAEQLAEFLDECILENIYTEDEATEYIKEFMTNFNEMSQNTLNEANIINEDLGDTQGPDMTYWMTGLGGIFGGFFGIVIALIMRGKTKMAIRMLENSMNKIVEKVDDGVNKGKGRGLWARIKTTIGKWFGKDKSSENEGEQNTICLRTLQENFQADTATKAMVFCKKMGILPDDWNSAMAALRANDCRSGSLNNFRTSIVDPVIELGNMRVKK